jgi:transcriptional regulator GlxA family with amidase domain
MRGFSHGLEELVLRIPWTVFADATGIDHVARPMVVSFSSGANPAARALARKVGAVVRSQKPQPADEAVLLELVAALGGADREVLSTAHRAAAQTYIDEHLANQALSAPEVAAAVGISPRHLSRVFAEAGTTVSRCIMASRLEAARSLLEKPTTATMTIADVARRCGFTSTTHFSNAFRSRFGQRATDVRRGARASRTHRMD